MSLSQLDIKTVKGEVIRLLLDKQVAAGLLKPTEVASKEKEYQDRFSTTTLTPTARLQSGVTDVFAFNDMNLEFQVSLMTLFKYLTELNNTINTHQEMNTSSLSALHTALDALEEEIMAYEDMKRLGNGVHYETLHFNDGTCLSPDASFYTERFGERVDGVYCAYADSETKEISLRHAVVLDMKSYEQDVTTWNVNLTKQLGGLFSYGSAHSKNLNRLKTTSNRTYWSDTLFTNEPLRVSFQSARPLDEKELKDFYYGIQQGALFELEFVFESVSRINELFLSPYSEYPMELIAIRYKMTDDNDEALKEVFTPDHENPLRRSVTLDKAKRLSFEEINCKRLYLIFNQVHYTEEELIVKQNDLFKNNLWLTLNQSQETPLSEEVLYRPVYYDAFKENLNYQALLALNEKVDQLDLKKLLLEDTQSYTPLSKCKYQYGFYTINPQYVEYLETSIFVTEAFGTSGNIETVELEVKETLPGVDGLTLTDIEYYVLTSENGTSLELPLLPIGREIIESERLQLVGDYCPLRFAAKEVFAVYQNDRPLILGVDYELVYEGANAPVGVRLNGFLKTNLYSVSYLPTSNAYKLTLSNQLGQLQETFAGSGQAVYELSEYPVLSETIEVKLINKMTGWTLSESGSGIRHVTNMSDPSSSYLNFDSTDTIQYYLYNGQLYFNQPISERYDIEIHYAHAISSIRLKGIMRRNHQKHKWLSPTLDQLTLKIQTL